MRLASWILCLGVASCAGPRGGVTPEDGVEGPASPVIGCGPVDRARASDESARRPAAPRSVLMVGNSFTFWNGGLWKPLEAGLRTVQPDASVRACMRGGASLEVQWGREKVQRWIQSGEHEVVVLQGDIPEASVASFEEHAALLIELCRAHGAEPVLFETWDYARLDWCSMEDIADAHRRVAARHGVRVIPVGEAWALARAQRPALDLYDQDREHPNLRGSYLALVMIHAALTHAEEGDLLPVPPAWSGLDAEEAAWLRALAAEVLGLGEG